MTTKIRMRRRGPLVVEGDFQIFDGDDQPIDLGEAKKIKLCRCGHSKSAPVCDGSHYRTDFEADS